MDEPRETVASFSNELEAHLARSMLEAAGIAATVHRYSRYRAIAGGGYLLKTTLSDVERARALLARLDAEVDMDEYVDRDDATCCRCPKCNSVNVQARPLTAKQTVLCALTVGVFLLLLKREWRCKKCGHQWHGQRPQAIESRKKEPQ